MMPLKVSQLASDTRSRLLEVAATRVRHQGFYQTSLDEIAADANIAKATIYHHFSSKTELGKALIDYDVDKYLSFLDQQIFNTQNPGLQQLKKLCDFVLQEFEHGDLEKGCPICNLVSELINDSDEFRERLDHFFQAYRERITRSMSTAQEKSEISKEFTAENLSTLFLSQLQGSVLLARTTIRNGLREQGVALLRQCFELFFQLAEKAAATAGPHKSNATYGKSAEAR